MENNRQHSFTGRIIGHLYDIFRIWSHYIKMIFKDAGLLTFFVLLPLAYPLVYAYIYNNEAAREVPMVVVDNSKSTLSREFTRKVDASAEVVVVGYCNDMEEAKDAVWSGKAFGIVLIPEDFSRKLVYTHEQSPVIFYSDMSGLLLYKAMLVTLTDVSLEMGKKIEQSNLSGLTAQEQEAASNAILATEVNLFNPKAGFGSFLIPAIMILLIQQALLLGVGMMFGTAKELGGPAIVNTISSRFMGLVFKFVVGKALCCFMTFALASVWLLRIVPALFNFPMVGDSGEIALFLLPYLLACVFFAIAASSVIRDRETPFIIFVFTSVPLLFLSGISWPEASMSDGWRCFSYLFPSTLGVQGFVRLNTAGALLNDVKPQYIGLWIQTAVYFILAICCYAYYLFEMFNAGKNVMSKDSNSQ